MESIFQKKKLIYTIAKEQSFSKAAQELFIAQPSLSLMVKNLEEELGTPLFDRSCKPIRLTEAGQEYLRAAEQIFGIEHTYNEFITSLNNLQTGSLRIGCSQLLASLVLPAFVSEFIRDYPNINLSIADANSDTLENQLANGSLDIVINSSELSLELFEQKKLCPEYLLLAVPAKFPENALCKDFALSFDDIRHNRHLFSNIPPVPLEIFSKTPFVLVNRHDDLRKLTNTIFQEAGFKPRVLFEQDRLTTLYTYVELGTAATIVSDTLVQNIRGGYTEGVVYYILPTPRSTRSISVYYKKNKYCTKSMLAFMERLNKIC